MTIEIEAPDGEIIEFPDGTPDAQIESVMAENFKPPEPTGNLLDFGEQAVRGASSRIANVAALPYRAADGILETVSGGHIGLPDYRGSAIDRTFTPPKDGGGTAAGRYGSAVGKVAGDAAVPAGGMVAAAPRIVTNVAQQVPTIMNRIMASVATPFAQRPAAAVGGELVAAGGAGLGQELAKEAGGGPVAQTFGGLAGAFAPAAVSLPFRGINRAVRSAETNTGQDGADAQLAEMLDPATLRGQLATGTTRTNQAAQTETMQILGEEMVRNGGDQVAARAATLQRLQAQGARPRAAQDRMRRLETAQQDSNLLLGEYPAIAQANAATRNNLTPPTLTEDAATSLTQRAGRTELDTPAADQLDYLANASSMGSAREIQTAVHGRALELTDSLRNTLRSFSPGGRTIDDAANMMGNLEAQASAAYAHAYRQPARPAQLQRGLTRAANVALTRLRGRGGEHRQAMERAIESMYFDQPNGSMRIAPTLRIAQDVRTELRGMMEAYRRQGRNDIVRTLEPLYRDITNVMGRVNPAWRTANDQWANLRLNEFATELGDGLAKTASPRFREQMAEFGRMAPAAQDYVRIHTAQNMLDMIENAGPGRDLSKLFGRPHFQNLVRQMFGNAQAVAFSRALAEQRVAANTKTLIGNSRTAKRLSTRESAEADLDLVANSQTYSWDGVKGWILKQVRDTLAERRRAPLARALATPVRNTAQIAEHLERATVAHRQRLNPPAQPEGLGLPSIVPGTVPLGVAADHLGSDGGQ